MKVMKNSLKHDVYRKARGGYSRFFNIFCAECKTFLALYQKDDSGPLKRLYLDRIAAPDTLAGHKIIPLKKVPPFDL